MASESGGGQTESSNALGVRTAEGIVDIKLNGMGRPTEECESHVNERWKQPAVSRVPRDTRNPVGKRGDHPPSLNTTW